MSKSNSILTNFSECLTTVETNFKLLQINLQNNNLPPNLQINLQNNNLQINESESLVKPILIREPRKTDINIKYFIDRMETPPIDNFPVLGTSPILKFEN